jgi:hypothetical protein
MLHLPVLSATEMARLVPMDQAELEAYADALFRQWMSIRERPYRTWASLRDCEREKYRMCVRAVVGSGRDRERGGRSMFTQWTALHDDPRGWWDLDEEERTQYRRCVQAVFGIGTAVVFHGKAA